MTNTPRHQRSSRLPKFLFGTPYYPEHWTPEDRFNDPELMAAAGVNVVRMAEFAWDLMEPRRGAFDFSLFDETITRLGARGIDTILCTPTATPPRWLTAENEEWMRVAADGRRMAHGSRQHCCTNHKGFRAESERITRAMAEHFAENPHVIGWQTDNEFHCHFSECYCAACLAGFRVWLQKKYGDIATLNRAWGTAFWALTYDDFEQIVLPYHDRPTYTNPSQNLDYLRFLSDGVCEFQRGQVQVLRATQPRWWITHNGAFDHIDFWRFGEDLDFMAIDIYPAFEPDHVNKYTQGAITAEKARSATGTFIVPEQQGGAGGQRSYFHPSVVPGQMRLWAYQAIAHGADGMMHFRWRTCRFGAEFNWYGILDHDNIPRRRYREFAQEGAELQRIGGKILGAPVLVHAAILCEQDQDEAHVTMHHGFGGPAIQRRLAYRALTASHFPVGFVNAADSFDGLKWILIPSFPLMDADLAARLRAFVENGGVLIATARTATRNRDNHMISQTPPGLLSDLFGMTVEEFGKLGIPALKLDAIPAGEVFEILQPRGAEVLARWNAANAAPHAAPGEPAITLNRVGKGAAIYVGTHLTEENTPALIEFFTRYGDLTSLAQANEQVEITCRHATDRRLHFVLNHGTVPAPVTGLPAGIELLTQTPCDGNLTLPPYGVAIVESFLPTLR